MVQLNYDNDSVACYTNGVLNKVATIEPATDNGQMLAFGNMPVVVEPPSFNGQYDEIRLRGGSLSADRIKADYDMIANRDFCTYGKVGKQND